MLCEFAAAKGIQPLETESIKSFCKHLSETLTGHIGNPARMFGLRTESMFAFVTAAMGQCKVINQEDCGYTFSPDSTKIRRPDFRLVTKSGGELLVEVKNFHQKTAHEPYKLTQEYYDSLTEYADIMKTKLYLAIFWSNWKVWTLVDFAKLTPANPIRLKDVLPINEMAMLGDCILASEPKLILRFTTASDKPRRVDAGGVASFTIESAEMFVNSERIVDPVEKKIAWFLFQFSKWGNLDQPAVVRDGELEQFDMVLSPKEEEAQEGQPFDSHGFLSQLVSNQYLSLTCKDESLKRLSPNSNPDALGVLIPSDYEGKVLKLWKFVQEPNRGF